MKRQSLSLTEPFIECVIYARVSTAKQAVENASIETQLTACREFARNKGWHIRAEFVDPGASAWSDKGRPEFDEMVGRAVTQLSPFQAIIVYDQSRFYRSVRQSEATRHQLRQHGVKVWSVMQPYEDDGLFGSFAISMQAVIDEQQSRVTSMKVRDGMIANAKAGFYVGGNVPFGYRLEVVEKRGSKLKHNLAVEDSQAEVVRHIFNLYEGGLGYQSIVAQLNKDGITRKRGKPWSNSNVEGLLRNPTYIGRALYRPTDPVTKATLPAEHWIEIPCPAIVEETQFENVRRIAESRNPSKTPPRYVTSDAVLGGLARCGRCGGNLQICTGTSARGNVYHYYKCAERLHKGSCPGGKATIIRRDELENAVVEKMANDLLTAERVQATVERATERQRNATVSSSEKIAQLRNQLTGAKRREENLWELAATLGIVAQEGFTAKLSTVQSEMASLRRQMAAYEKLIANSVRSLTIEEAAVRVADMKRLLLNADVRRQRSFVHALVQQVVVRDDVIEIYGFESTLAEAASGFNVVSSAVRGSDREWWALTGSNRRPTRCKRAALPAELSAPLREDAPLASRADRTRLLETPTSPPRAAPGLRQIIGSPRVRAIAT